MPNPENLRRITSEQAREMGKKSSRGKAVGTILRELLDKKIEINDPIMKKKIKESIAYAMAMKLIGKALKGDTKAINDVIDRTEGKPIQQINNTNDGHLVIEKKVFNEDSANYKSDEIEPIPQERNSGIIDKV